MAILYKAPNTTQTENGSIDPPVDPYIDPNKRKFKYRIAGHKSAPYFGEWMRDPITQEKAAKQFGTGIALRAADKVDKIPIIDMRKIASLSPLGYQDFTESYLKASKSTSRANDKKVLDRMKFYGNTFNPTTGRGVQGLQVKGFKGIGTIFPIENPDAQGTVTHEFTHGSGIQGAAEKYIANKWGAKQIPYSKLRDMGYDESDTQLQYFRDIGIKKDGTYGEGVYPRIMQLRKVMGLKPGDKITPEMLKSTKFEEKQSPLRGLRANWDDATISEILNTVAKNEDNTVSNTLIS